MQKQRKNFPLPSFYRDNDLIMFKCFLKNCHKILPVILVFVLWEVTALSVESFRGVEFPDPFETIHRLYELFNGQKLSGHSLSMHILASLERWLYGFSIAVAGGISFGLLVSWSRWFERTTRGIPQFLLLVPGLAWIPVAILILGIGESATVAMISISAFAPIAISVIDGIRGVDSNYIRAAEMMGTGRGRLFFQVLLPASLPSIISGLRIGLGTAWRVLVAAEMVVGTGTGLGYSIIQARWTLDYSASFACIGIIVAIGLFFEKFLLRWLEMKTVDLWAA